MWGYLLIFNKSDSQCPLHNRQAGKLRPDGQSSHAPTSYCHQLGSLAHLTQKKQLGRYLLKKYTFLMPHHSECFTWYIRQIEVFIQLFLSYPYGYFCHALAQNKDSRSLEKYQLYRIMNRTYKSAPPPSKKDDSERGSKWIFSQFQCFFLKYLPISAIFVLLFRRKMPKKWIIDNRST